jgi:hypothetical protein
LGSREIQPNFIISSLTWKPLLNFKKLAPAYDIYCAIVPFTAWSRPRRPDPPERRGQLLYRRKAGLMFDPWMKVWQLMHG